MYRIKNFPSELGFEPFRSRGCDCKLRSHGYKRRDLAGNACFFYFVINCLNFLRLGFPRALALLLLFRDNDRMQTASKEGGGSSGGGVRIFLIPVFCSRILSRCLCPHTPLISTLGAESFKANNFDSAPPPRKGKVPLRQQRIHFHSSNFRFPLRGVGKRAKGGWGGRFPSK